MPPPAGVEPALRRLARNRTASAHQLALDALREIGREIDRWATLPPNAARAAARSAARELDRTQPAMGLFRTWAREWRDRTRRGDPGRPDRWARRWERRWAARLRSEPEQLARRVVARLPPGQRLLTLSRSSTLLAALRALPRARRPKEVVVLESRPGGEGRRFAADLRSAGFRARWVKDRHRGRALRAVDLVLIGADALEPDGSVLHKVGTRALARGAHALGVPVIVVAGRSKRSPARLPARRLPPAFDRTPRRWIRAYWTDR